MDSILNKVEAALAKHGFSTAKAGAKSALFAQCLKALEHAEAGAKAFFVPGRVEMLGKHTDYCGGRSVVAAVDQGIAVVVTPRDDRLVRFLDPMFGGSAEFELSADLKPTVGHWSNYPMTVARRISRDFPGPLRGADVAISSDLVAASGLSSSSALIIASFLAMSTVNDLAATDVYRKELADPTELACYLAAIEGGKGYGPFQADHGVGTAGGSEDHTAILCSRAGELGVYSYRPVRAETTVAFPEDLCIVIASSGVVAEKTGAAMGLYNRASRLASVACEVAAAALGVEADDLASLAHKAGADAIGAALRASRNSEFGAHDLAVRFEHFVSESEIVIPKAVRALKAGDLEEWGRKVDISQIKGAELLGNQVPETILLARSARENGAVAASAFGAGFGGSVWAMVPRVKASGFIQDWRGDYLTAFPERGGAARFFVTHPGPAAFEVGV